MNRKEIQRTLDQIAKIILEDAQKRDRQSPNRMSAPENTIQKSDRLTASKIPHLSESIDRAGDHAVYNKSSFQDAQQIQDYLDQLGKLVNSSDPGQKSTIKDQDPPIDLSEEEIEMSRKPKAPELLPKSRSASDSSPQQFQSIQVTPSKEESLEINSSEPDPKSTIHTQNPPIDLSEEEIEMSRKPKDAELLPKSRSASDSSPQQFQSIQVTPSKQESLEIKDIETAGILEELLEQFSLDPRNAEAINYEDLLEQLALDRTDPKTVKELDQLLSRLTDQSMPENSSLSIAKQLEMDDLLEESDDRVSQSKTPVDQPGSGLATQKDLFSPLLSDIGQTDFEKISQKTIKRGKIVAFSLLFMGLILVPWGIYQYFKSTEHQIEKKVTKVLESSPDLAFYHVQADVQGKSLFLTGKLPSQHLRDRAQSIASLAAPNLLLNNKIIVVDQPADMVQVESEVVEVINILNQIDGIKISAQFNQGNVVLEGTSIQHITIKNITKIFEDIPGIRQVSNQIKIQPVSVSIRIYFNQNSTEISEIDVPSKIQPIKELIQKYPNLKLKIIGYSHKTESSHETLGLKRAQAVENFLEDQGIDRRRIQAVGEKGSPPEISSNQDRWLSRCVVFEIIQSDLENPGDSME